MMKSAMTLPARVGIGAVSMLLVLAWGGVTATARTQADRPNVVWLTCEDISPDLGCYGVEYAITPVLDTLAQQGVRYTQAVGISGVCAVNRSCLITGMYPSTIGSQDMRSRIRLPEAIPTYSELLREAGYYCTNNSKTDYNFPAPAEAWDESSRQAHWRNREPGQPFFAVFNYTGTHESQVWEKNHRRHAEKLSADELHDPAHAPVPPFHPDTPEVRRDWANYHDNITGLDHWIDNRLSELEEAGLDENTIVFFYSDHGAGMPMCKKWVWEAGLRVPLIVRFPEQFQHLAPSQPGSTTDQLVSFVDFPPTLLSLVGVDVPPHMQGRAFLGAEAKPPRKYAFAIRDRMAEWFDVVRVVRGHKYQYHRNFMPHRAWAPFCSYTLTMPTAQVCARLHEQGKLNPVQDRFFQHKPSEELYDLEADPHMVNNLADQPRYNDALARMRRELRQWQLRTRDLGLLSEYEMHRRAENSTQYEVGQSPTAYPLEKILPVAELASGREPGSLSELVALLDDEEPAVRWWATLGLLRRGDDLREAKTELEGCLQDDSPLVRVAAAEALYQLGETEPAVAVLTDALKHDTPFVRLRALNVLYHMGDDARPAIPAIKQASMKGIHPATYANRMVDYLAPATGKINRDVPK
ncbi:MAG: sulfatase-like hydrolase/transferase [Planctomycetota bacterium]